MSQKEIQYVAVDDSMLVPGSKRFGNYVIDFIVQYLLIMVIGFMAGLAYQLLGWGAFYNWIIQAGTLEQYLLGATVGFCYYTFFEALFQRTPGKFVTRTKVVMPDGSKPAIGTIALRSLCRFIPLEHFTFFGDRSRGIHDSLPETYVVDVNAYEHALNLQRSFDEIGKTDY